MRNILAVAIGVVGGLMFAPASASATTVVFHTLAEPYGLVELPTDLPATQVVYGALDDDPDMYQFVLTATTTVDFTLYAVDETVEIPAFSGILVQDEVERGVREITRLPAPLLNWSSYRDQTTKMRYQQSETQSAELAPGTYRFEVSTPDNQGRYRLDIAGPEDTRRGYFATVADVRAVHDFHGASVFALLSVGVIQFPLVLVIIVIGSIATWRYARRHRLV